MPWSIVRRKEKYCVQNDDTDEILKCYPTKEEAEKYKNALYANVPHARIKALDEMVLDVLGIPYGAPNNLDADGEYFNHQTKLFEQYYNNGLPPIVYYHGYGPDGKPMGSAEYIGKSISYEDKPEGRWFRVILDKASALARRVWQAAKEGLAYASSGSIHHLARSDDDGFIREWPLAELSVFDVDANRQPANKYAVAIPAMKTVYKQAGIVLPDGFDIDSQKTSLEEAVDDEVDTRQKSTIKGAVKMSDKDFTQVDIDRAKKEAEDALLAKQAAERKAQEEEQARIDAAVKAEREKLEAEHADKIKELEEAAMKGRRLDDNPDGDELEPGSAPWVAKYGYTWKYDDLDPGAHALMVGVLKAAKKVGRSDGGASEQAVKALHIKMIETEDKDGILIRPKMAMKAAGMPLSATKANDLNYSTYASYGDDWIGQTYSTQLWERIRLEARIAALMPTVVIPQGSESVIIPLQSTPPTFYKVAQATAQDSNPGPITRTVTTSKMGTDSQTLSVAKMGAATYYAGELEEDSLIMWAEELRNAMVIEGNEVLEHLLIDGDIETGASANINTIGGTPSGNEAYLLFDGFRKLALVTNTAQARAGGTLTAADFLETAKLMGLGGKNAIQKDKVIFISDLWTHWKTLELEEVKTKDVFVSPTIENGELTGLWGYKFYPSANMHRANQDTTYGLKANSDGKVDLTTAANNTTGSILAVRPDQWRLGIKRRMTIEVTRVPSADSSEIVALMRVGLVYRDTEASAITYGLGV